MKPATTTTYLGKVLKMATTGLWGARDTRQCLCNWLVDVWQRPTGQRARGGSSKILSVAFNIVAHMSEKRMKKIVTLTLVD